MVAMQCALQHADKERGRLICRPACRRGIGAENRHGKGGQWRDENARAISKRALQSDMDQESYRLRNPLGPSCATSSVSNQRDCPPQCLNISRSSADCGDELVIF